MATGGREYFALPRVLRYDGAQGGCREKQVINQSDRAVAVLQQLIERGELRPGSMVSERSLMELTGFGRTPIREAIQRLALSRMLRIHPSRGIEIPAISVEDQLSALEVRRATEVLAIALACERATQAERQQMRDLAASLEGEFSLEDYAETVRQTHALVIEAAHNPYLEALMTPLQALSRRFWVMHIQDEAADIGIGKAFHRRILMAIAEGDAGAATSASMELNDYLVRFALDVISMRARPRGIAVSAP
nr:GntR family transcriptional regulator [Paracoccus versutus]